MGLEIINIIKKRKGITNEELSSMSGIPKGTIDKITAGTTKDPKLETIKAIAKVLECSLNDFDQIKNPPAEAGEIDIQKDRLIKNYEALNDEGKEKLAEQSEMMVLSGMYIKNNQSNVCKEA